MRHCRGCCQYVSRRSSALGTCTAPCFTIAADRRRRKCRPPSLPSKINSCCRRTVRRPRHVRAGPLPGPGLGPTATHRRPRLRNPIMALFRRWPVYEPRHRCANPENFAPRKLSTDRKQTRRSAVHNLLPTLLILTVTFAIHWTDYAIMILKHLQQFITYTK